MNAHRFLRLGVTLLASGFFAFGLINTAHARVMRVSLSGNAATVLHEALSTLAQADHDYQGHRVKAMEQIHLALGGHLGKTHARTHLTTRVRHSTNQAGGREREPQTNSDAQLRTAQGLLEQASNEVSGAALQHVNAAIAELNTALSIR